MADDAFGMQADEGTELWDPEDADDCDDEAELFAPPSTQSSHPANSAGILREPVTEPAVRWDQVRTCLQKGCADVDSSQLAKRPIQLH